MTGLCSWNGLPPARHAAVHALTHRADEFPSNGSLLAHGNGRSYGDVCLNAGGTLMHTRWLDHALQLDESAGVLRVEAGARLADVLALLLPRGFWLPVVPGTAWATVGGAIANDVHGKNHPTAGSFGHHVLRLALRGSDGSVRVCSPLENANHFRATVGGLGLTGLIVWAELRLMRVRDAGLVTRSQRFSRLDEFWSLAQGDWPYEVAWLDCLHRSGRGWLFQARHATSSDAPTPSLRPRARRFPFMPPVSLVGPLTLRAFNAAYFLAPRPSAEAVVHALAYFFPLDAIADWYRLYGPRGFYQYQCVLPPPTQREALRELLQRISRSGEGSFLAVLKRFGAQPPAGMLSFPREGVTLALDFPNRGARTLALFHELDAVVHNAGGALYPGKDARMPPELFRAGFPQWERFSQFIDPRFQSDFWRRMNA